MKKILTLTLFAMCFSVIANAQIQKGNFLVGGDLADFNLNLNSGKQFNINLQPKIGFFIRDNIAIGPYVNLGLSTAKDFGTSVSYGVGAFGRYYVNNKTMDVVKHGRFFVEANAGIEGDNPVSGSSTNGLGLGVGPGFAYFITPNVGLEGLLKYNGIVGFGSSVTSSTLGLGVGFQIYLNSRKMQKRVENM